MNSWSCVHSYWTVEKGWMDTRRKYLWLSLMRCCKYDPFIQAASNEIKVPLFPREYVGPCYQIKLLLHCLSLLHVVLQQALSCDRKHAVPSECQQAMLWPHCCPNLSLTSLTALPVDRLRQHGKTRISEFHRQSRTEMGKGSLCKHYPEGHNGKTALALSCRRALNVGSIFPDPCQN